MKEFQFITHDNKDAYFNIASEEYLLKHTDGYYFYLWINDPAVIVGVNQNAIEEVNLDYTQSNSIKVVRRITGGGTVYHDGGNLCYTVIAPFNAEQDNYKAFTKPVIEYLNELGVKAEFSGRNDIVVDGKKISGNAQTVYKDRIMHHGTILFDTDMQVLSHALKPSKIKMESKGIKSVRARVTNVKEHLNSDMTMQEFKDGLAQKFSQSFARYEFTKDDIIEITKLIEQKYSSYEWNIGCSPKGKNQFTKKFDFGIFSLFFNTVDGKIADAEIRGDFFSKKDVKPFADALCGVRFTKSELLNAFTNVGDYIEKATGEQIVDALFEV
ncbi:MAG: lipoate--protein ligase [Clostridiales bacterium]|nr:lipoate--protein ligase [Clostridiales bacterium]